jgi:hypothetical protein
MNAPNGQVAPPAPAKGPMRRIVATLIFGGLVFFALWLFAFSVFTSLMIASGCCVAVSAASAVSQVVVTVLDLIATVVLTVVGAIMAVVVGILSIFS